MEPIKTFPGTNIPVNTPAVVGTPTPTVPTPPVTEVKTPQTATTVVVETTPEGVEYCLGEFDGGLAKGLKYAYPRFPSVEVLAATYGADAILALVNSSIKARIATKVKNSKIPQNVSSQIMVAQLETLKKADPSGRGLIFTIDEAKAYKPGEREPGLKDMIDNIMERMKAGEEISIEEFKAVMLKGALKKRTTVES